LRGAYLDRFDLLEAVGWLGQGFYFTRFLVQWLMSERAGRIVVPRSFWWMSLLGAGCATAYAFSKGSLVFMAGPATNLFVFVENLRLDRTGRPLGARLLLPFALGVVTLVAITLTTDLEKRLAADPVLWICVGIAGSGLWMIRFPLQWWLAERRVHATLPPVFFMVSFVGSVLLLAYAIRGGNPIFIAGMLPGPFLYGRSLWLSRRSG